MEGDPGENRAPGLNYNVGNLFHLAALTQQDALNGTGNLPIGPKRVSSVQDFAAQLISNGLITGSVIYFGHGAGESPNLVGTRGSLLAPGEGQGEDTNISSRNVNLLTNSQLAIGATITLRACYAGFGSGSYSIAQLIANRLQRKVFATSAGSFFAVSPNARHGAGRNLPNQKPIYLIPDGGGPLGTFLPAFGR